MGFYSEYLDKGMSFQDLTAERKVQLKRISQLRSGRDVLIYASDVSKTGQAPIAVSYDDLLPLTDQLANLKGQKVDVILETPGGSAEVAEDIVKLLRAKYSEVAFIIPGMAKSAGTIIVMSGDEILMDPASSLGPIDAQIQWEGKSFSAEAFLKGLDKIKEEVATSGSLNRAYIPILQRISPGEIQHFINALEFAKTLVTDWLNNYKFKNWKNHSRTGELVTEEERRNKAREIAGILCNHTRWLTHGRSIKLADLEEIGLRITDYGKEQQLSDAIGRYHVLLEMTFSSNIYKVFETAESQIYRFLAPAGALMAPPPLGGGAPAAGHVLAQIKCGKCGKDHSIQCDFGQLQPLQPGAKKYPKDDILICDQCKTPHNLGDLRRQLELQLKKEIIRT